MFLNFREEMVRERERDLQRRLRSSSLRRQAPVDGGAKVPGDRPASLPLEGRAERMPHVRPAEL